MKKLEAYFKRQDALPRNKIAERMGVHPSTITRMVKGQLVPTVLIALALEKATDGYVRCRDWLNK